MVTSYTNFSGTWSGVRVLNGRPKDDKVEIKQVSDELIEMIRGDSQSFFLNKPSVTDIEGADKGQRYREVTVYDFRWDERRETILTSAKWLGWYLDQSGTWSGEGSGTIKMSGEKLIITRSFKSTFGSGEEVSEYSRLF